MAELKNAERQQQGTASADRQAEEYRLIQLNRVLGAPAERQLIYPLKYLTPAEVEECLTLAKTDDLAGVRDVIDEARERELGKNDGKDNVVINIWNMLAGIADLNKKA